MFDEAAKPYVRYVLRFIICALACEIVWLVKITIGSFKCRRKLEEHLRKLNNRPLKTREVRMRPRPISFGRRHRTEASCVVCSSNKLEIILLPCGHVCLCEDCSIHVKFNCPICRSKIKRKYRAYVC